jgi:4-amino-4-deoxy-L-arabinose transferase-like glycosyltransferase
MKVEFSNRFEQELVTVAPTVFWLILIGAELADASRAIRTAAACVSLLTFVIVAWYGRRLAKREREGRPQ